ncbi:MAG: hypothetical protein M1820_002192 [Bogoriella megaspora]|nr:MAG: hypothetical protein M1820_002192 [Bogoriella megaspora]
MATQRPSGDIDFRQSRYSLRSSLPQKSRNAPETPREQTRAELSLPTPPRNTPETPREEAQAEVTHDNDVDAAIQLTSPYLPLLTRLQSPEPTVVECSSPEDDISEMPAIRTLGGIQYTPSEDQESEYIPARKEKWRCRSCMSRQLKDPPSQPKNPLQWPIMTREQIYDMTAPGNIRATYNPYGLLDTLPGASAVSSQNRQSRNADNRAPFRSSKSDINLSDTRSDKT